MSKLLTTKQVAVRYGRSKTYICLLAQAGLLKSRSLGSGYNARYVFEENELPECLPSAGREEDKLPEILPQFKRQEEG